MPAKIEQALEAHRAGKLQEAELLYVAILHDEPKHPDANHNLGLMAVAANNFALGLSLLGAALEANPNHPQYWIGYIDALIKDQQLDNARNVLDQAKAQGLSGEQVDALSQQLAPRSEEVGADKTQSLTFAQQRRKLPAKKEKKKNASSSQGSPGQSRGPSQAEVNALLAQYQSGQYAVAQTLAVAITQKYPQNQFGWKVLGEALGQLGRPLEALVAMKKAVGLMSNDAEAHSNLGNLLTSLGRIEEAEKVCRKATMLDPGLVEGHTNLGNALKALGALGDAVVSYEKALSIKPNYFLANYNLGLTLKALGKLDEADASYRRAIDLAPNFANAYSDLGITLKDLGRLEEAEASYRQAIALKPDFAEAHINLGNALKDLGRPEEAEASYRQAISLKPDLVEAHLNLGTALKDLGRLEEAEASYRQAISLKPEYADAHSNLLFLRSHMPTIGAEQLYEEHCEFGRKFEEPVRSSWPLHTNAKELTRTLRIGFVSGDLRHHAVASFIEPILRHLSTREELSLHAYYNYHSVDLVSKRLQGYFASWSRVISLSDADLAEKICADGIDILIDLSGHTAYNRLPVFARKPAPLQASWMGYPGTTGLESMDYYFCDKRWLPQDQFVSQFTEKLLYLPASAAFLPEKEAPAVSELPALGNGYVTFGSFNRLDKINQVTVQVWSRVMRAVPKSRMVLGGVTSDESKQRITDWFAQEGVAADSLTMYPRMRLGEYLALHSDVDICLDAFPYGGGTTIFHALWMGVPTVTLAGGTPPSRGGVTILGSCGLDEFVSRDVDSFVQTGVLMATDVDGLSTIRAGMRARVSASPAWRSELIAQGFELGLRMMWQRWCAGLPAQSLDTSPGTEDYK